MHSRSIGGLLLLFLIAVTGASATVITGQTFSNTTFNATGANILLSVSGVDVYADRLEVTNTSISLQNVSYNTTWANFSFSLLNFTTPNSSQFSYQFPNVSSSSGNIITILNGLSQNVSNVTVIVGTNGIVPSSSLLTFPDGTTQYPSYSYDSVGGRITFSASFPSGTSYLTINSTPTHIPDSATCNSTLTGFDSFANSLTIFAGIILLIVVVGWFVSSGITHQDGEVSNIDWNLLLGLAIGFTGLCLIISMLASALGGLCS